MTAQLVLQWVLTHWHQIGATLSALAYLAMTIAVGLKEHPLPGEGRLSFWWRIAGRAAFSTFKNIYGTWKVPGFKPRLEYIVLDSVPRELPGVPTDKNWPAPAGSGPGTPVAGDGGEGEGEAVGKAERGPEGPPGPVLG